MTESIHAKGLQQFGDLKARQPDLDVEQGQIYGFLGPMAVVKRLQSVCLRG